MGADLPPVQTVTHITVDIQASSPIASQDDMAKLLFSSCSPPDWSI
jgi:hypothetical protein